MTTTMPPEHFEDLYRGDPDPWNFASSDYESAKYAATLAALPALRYPAALEVGCSIGVLTEQLAGRCDRLLAIDASATAIGAARARCARLDNVVLSTAAVPNQFPDGRFELIVLSEMIYYLSVPDVRRLAERCGAAIAADGDILLVHWTGPTNYPLTGDEAAEAFIAAMQPRARPLQHVRKTEYRLDLLRAHDGDA